MKGCHRVPGNSRYSPTLLHLASWSRPSWIFRWSFRRPSRTWNGEKSAKIGRKRSCCCCKGWPSREALRTNRADVLWLGRQLGMLGRRSLLSSFFYSATNKESPTLREGVGWGKGGGIVSFRFRWGKATVAAEAGILVACGLQKNQPHLNMKLLLSTSGSLQHHRYSSLSCPDPS